MSGYGLEGTYEQFVPWLEKYVSILLCLDTGWKVRGSISWLAFFIVSILLCLDTGWKQFLQVAIHDGRYLFQSSYVWIRAGRNIRTIRSLAWKIRFNPLMSGYGLEEIDCAIVECLCGDVSILLCLDTGWKIVFTLVNDFNNSFNPLMSGYGLEAPFNGRMRVHKNSFNPLMSGYGLEECQNRWRKTQGNRLNPFISG